MIVAATSDEGAPKERVKEFKVGRVKCDGHRGTIMYIGEVTSKTGTWLGIDWDDPQRGKHDGSFGGHKYFETRYPTSGSFVRPEKVDFGISLVTAIQNRYGFKETTEVDEENLALAKRVMNAPFLEMVGFEKVNKMQSEFEALKQVNVHDYGVNNAGLCQELWLTCPNIEELCMSKNLLSSWETVAEIAAQLQHLRILDISDNHMVLPSKPEELKNSFLSLQHLIAGCINHSWDDILFCSWMWPGIKILQVPSNDIHVLSTPSVDILCQLKCLDLNGNPIKSWGEINKLGHLPCLEELNLTATDITEIFFPTDTPDQKTNLFSNLKNLYISYNKISSCQSVCELDKLLKLKNLKIMTNPLFLQENHETRRQLVIARIKNIEKLNGMEIQSTERKSAEYDYLKKYAQIWLNLSKCEDQEQVQHFLKEHSRFPCLIMKYGVPEEGELRILPDTLKSKIISVELFRPDHESPRLQKKLPRTMTIQKLIGLTQKLFNSGNEFPTLTYISSKQPNIEIPLNSEFKTLDFFSVEDGDKICVRW